MIDTLIELATEAGKVIREFYESGSFNTTLKSDNSPVTTADEKANELILRVLKQKFPEMPAISEEADNRVLETGTFFIIDPLDGTKGFLNKTDNFTVNIALIKNGKPVIGVIYSPISGELFYTSKGLESFKYNFFTKNRKIEQISVRLPQEFWYHLNSFYDTLSFPAPRQRAKSCARS